MDGSRFDQLTQFLSAGGTRRGLVRVLVTLPGVGGVLALAGGEESDAAGRRKRRKKRHKHGKGKHKDNRTGKRKGKGKPKKKPCQPQAPAETCADRCGIVENNCRESVDCGSCDCGACPVCQTCAAATRECVPDSGQQSCDNGDPCSISDSCDDGVCSPGTAAPDGTLCADGVCCGGLCTAAGCCAGSPACCAGTPCRSPDRCCGGTCILCLPSNASCGGPRPDCACACCSGESFVNAQGEVACR